MKQKVIPEKKNTGKNRKTVEGTLKSKRRRLYCAYFTLKKKVQ